MLDKISLVLVIIGALNWGSIGLFQFDLVAWIFGGQGAILDVAVDIRKGSPTYMKWVAVELSAENKKMLFIPKGCLHGFVTLTDNVEVTYKVDEYYSPENDRSVCFCDEEIGVEWGIENPVLSEKDKNAPLYSDSDVDFNF